MDNRLAHAMASSFDFTCHSQNPETQVVHIENGPSTTFVPPREKSRVYLRTGVQPFAREQHPLRATPR